MPGGRVLKSAVSLHRPFHTHGCIFSSQKEKGALAHLHPLRFVSRGHVAVSVLWGFLQTSQPNCPIWNTQHLNYCHNSRRRPSPGLPHQCFPKCSPRNTGSVRCSGPPPKTFMVKQFGEKICRLSMYISILKALRSPTTNKPFYQQFPSYFGHRTLSSPNIPEKMNCSVQHALGEVLTPHHPIL